MCGVVNVCGMYGTCMCGTYVYGALCGVCGACTCDACLCGGGHARVMHACVVCVCVYVFGMCCLAYCHRPAMSW